MVLHGHLDVVPALPGQFEPRIDGDRLYGRGAYDMKGALAAMMLTPRRCATRTASACGSGSSPTRSPRRRTTAAATTSSTAGFLGDFAITGEPTDMQIGVEAKGVLALRIEVSGRAAHSSTPWLGDNAVLKAIDVFRRSSRYRLRGRARSCSTARRSTSAGSWAATR